MRTFLIDCVNARMAIDNAVYNIDTSALASNIARIIYHFATAQGGIEYSDRPLTTVPFSDPSPYQTFVNAWLTAAAADNPPLQLAQAVAVKQGLAAAIYSSKRNAKTATVVPIRLAQNPSGAAPGWGFVSGIGPDYYQPTGGNTILEAGPTTSTSFAFTADTACPSGLCYWEFTSAVPPGVTGAAFGTIGGGAGGTEFGVMGAGGSLGYGFLGRDPTSGWSYVSDGRKAHNNSVVAYGTAWAIGDIIGCAFDASHGRMWFSKNGVWQGGATAAEIAAGTTTHAAYTGMPTNGIMYPAAQGYINTGGSTPVDQASFTLNFGPGFTYAPPSGYGPAISAVAPGDDVGATNLALAAAGNSGLTFTPVGGGSPVTATPVSVDTASAGLSASRYTLANSYSTISANIAACGSIAAVIALDVTAGWP